MENGGGQSKEGAVAGHSKWKSIANIDATNSRKLISSLLFNYHAFLLLVVNYCLADCLFSVQDTANTANTYTVPGTHFQLSCLWWIKSTRF